MPNSGWSFSGSQGSVLSTPKILNPSMKDWYQYRPWNLTHRAQLRESRHMTYHARAWYQYQPWNLTNRVSLRKSTHMTYHTTAPQGSVLYTPLILDPSMKDWYQYRPWNLSHRVQLRELKHMTYHTRALLPNSCGPMADGLFRDPKGRSYPHSKYWTHRWRIDINISHEI